MWWPNTIAIFIIFHFQVWKFPRKRLSSHTHKHTQMCTYSKEVYTNLFHQAHRLYKFTYTYIHTYTQNWKDTHIFQEEYFTGLSWGNNHFKHSIWDKHTSMQKHAWITRSNHCRSARLPLRGKSPSSFRLNIPEDIIQENQQSCIYFNTLLLSYFIPLTSTSCDTH